MDILIRKLKPDYNIIDIRDNDSYNIDHVYNSINIPMYELLGNPSFYIDRNNTYYIYCKSGFRSKGTCDILSMLGYDVVNVKDGFGK